VIWVSFRSDGESVSVCSLDDPDISLFIVSGMRSDIKVITVFSMLVVGAENVMIWSDRRFNVVFFSVNVVEDNGISCFLLFFSL
jgi:hypothetical protein